MGPDLAPKSARVAFALALALPLSFTSAAGAQQVLDRFDDGYLRYRLSELDAMAQSAVRSCQQIDAGCQDVWCLTNPAFDARVPSWPDARAAGAYCQQYRPEGDQSSVRALEPTLGDVYESPQDGWTTRGEPSECGNNDARCRDVSISSDRRLARLRVSVPYGSERRFARVEVILGLARQRRAPPWRDPRPAPRPDAALMDQYRMELRALAQQMAPACGVSLGERGARGAPVDLARTGIATWPQWPAGVDARVDCMHAISASQTSGSVMATHGDPSYASAGSVPWGPANARCVIPGRPCEQYATFASDPHRVNFHVEVRTPGDRGFVWVTVNLRVP